MPVFPFRITKGIKVVDLVLFKTTSNFNTSVLFALVGASLSVEGINPAAFGL